MTSSGSLQTWLAGTREIVERALDRYLTAGERAPAAITEAMRYSLFAGGKRLRPMLVLAAAEATAASAGLAVEAAAALALPSACALELIHTYSLVHDDLPAMDNDTLRRGRPTAHVVYGEGTAILSGDALLTEAFVLLAREPRVDEVPSISAAELAQRKLEAVRTIAEAAGAHGLCVGSPLVKPGAIGYPRPARRHRAGRGIDVEGIRRESFQIQVAPERQRLTGRQLRGDDALESVDRRPFGLVADRRGRIAVAALIHAFLALAIDRVRERRVIEGAEAQALDPYRQQVERQVVEIRNEVPIPAEQLVVSLPVVLRGPRVAGNQVRLRIDPPVRAGCAARLPETGIRQPCIHQHVR